MLQSHDPGEPPKEPPRSRASFLSYHSRECSICRHPERASIDQEFVEWGAVGSIAAAYRVQRRAIYRHAHATNLFERRNGDLRFALGRIIEQAGAVPVTADTIVRAVRLFACLNDEGGWIGPPTRPPLVRSHQRVASPAEAAVRSTHPNEQNTSQLIENTQSQPAQIDTVQTHENTRLSKGRSASRSWKPPTLVGGKRAFRPAKAASALAGLSPGLPHPANATCRPGTQV